MSETSFAFLAENLTQSFELLPVGDQRLEAYRDHLPDEWWNLMSGKQSISDALEVLWSPVVRRARGFIVRLATMTQGITLLVSPQAAFPPALYYLTRYYRGQAHGWLAGLPADHENVELINAELDVILPRSYRQFAEIHNGFVQDGDPAYGFQPLARLKRLSQLLPVEELPEAGEYSAENLLAFCGDGLGGWQCFDLSKPHWPDDYVTVSYSRAANEFVHRQSFWSFLKQFTITHLS